MHEFSFRYLVLVHKLEHNIKKQLALHSISVIVNISVMAKKTDYSRS